MSNRPDGPPPRKLDANDIRSPEENWWSHNLRIWLDGEEQTRCVSYDLDAGTLTRHAVDAEGKLVVRGTPRDPKIVKETVSGEIVLKVREGAA